MGRAFEFRKERKMKRWGKMSKTFTKIGRDIVMAVKASGPDPDNNSKLRAIIANAKNVNMPKDRVEAAIKRASSKDENNYEEIVYEGYAPYGVAILVECATDNHMRTVGNVRSYITRAGGTLGKTGSLDFVFERKGVFVVAAENTDPEELELELIDFGAEDISLEEDGINIYTSFADFGVMYKALEERKLNIVSAELQRFPLSFTDVSEEQAAEINKMLDKFDDDDDVGEVYHNMRVL